MRPYSPLFDKHPRKKRLCVGQRDYQCQRFDNGQPITVVLSALEVPRCENCGELVFTYDTEEQINRAYRAQADALCNGTSPANGAEETAGNKKAKS